MKRLCTVMIMVVMLFVFTSCNAISQDDYDAVVTERDKLQADYDVLATKNFELNEKSSKQMKDMIETQVALAKCYSSYRYIMMSVTAESYSNLSPGLSTDEWNYHLGKVSSGVPSAEDVSNLSGGRVDTSFPVIIMYNGTKCKYNPNIGNFEIVN